ncbi:hypothetical protein LTR85_008297 [Meristemomyces frigidus]|nr:hypothetical protein LTR85_008297 [Meristemomyces frigidus]
MGSLLSKPGASAIDTKQPPLHVSIIGAGIGGLALAIALNKQNVPYTIYESAGAYATVGAGVGIGPNAMRAMDMIDKRFRGKYDAVAIGNLTPGKEHVMMEAYLLEEGLGARQGWLGKPWGSPAYTRTAAHRKTLLDIMTSFIPESTVKFNKQVAGIKQLRDKVELTFTDGETIETSAVIGCDGIKGASRRYVLGSRYPDEVLAKYNNQYAYRAIIRMSEAREVLGDLANDAKMYFGRGINLSTYVISEGQEINVVGFVRDPEPWPYDDKVTREVTREKMVADFTAQNIDPRLLKLLDWAKPVQWAMSHHPKTSTYQNGLVCLLGDSAHATLPNQAAGAGQCLEDALILSRLLGRVGATVGSKPAQCDVSSELNAAFEAYESVRRPRAQKQIETSVECGKVYSLMHPDIGTDMNKTVKNLNSRFDWLWKHDLDADVKLAEDRYAELVAMKD